MNSDNFLLTIAAIAVIVSIIGISTTYSSISSFENILTGYATETGYVNISITSQANINITSANGGGDKTLYWGSGTVDSGKDYAFLVSNGTTTNSSTFQTVNNGFIIENIGNTDVTFAVHADQAAAAFLDGTSPQFKYNVSDYENNSCVDWVGGYKATYKDFTTSPVTVCNNFTKYDNPATGFNDSLRMDVLMVVPSDSKTGDLKATVTLTYSGV